MLSRRETLRGGAATVAAIAGAGAVAARVAVDDAAVTAAARTYWKTHALWMAASDNEEVFNALHYRVMHAYDRLMEIPSSSVKDLATKVRVCRDFWDGCMIEIDDGNQLGGLLDDIERVAGRAS